MKRIKINNSTKNIIWRRQNGRCACCLDFGQEYHHVLPVSLGGDNSSNNIVFLCEEHHNLLHLGDVDIILSVLEYVYYIKENKMPESLEEIKNIAEKIKTESVIKKV